jgi:3-oxoacyl-(acyl-carrier-protein) synthase
VTAPRLAGEVLVTGVGMHTAFGGAEATRAAVEAGRSALARWRHPDADGFPEVAAAPVAPAAAGDLPVDRKLLKYASPAAELAVAAAGRALREAGLLGEGAQGARAGMGLFVATGLIGFELGQVARAISEAGAGPWVADGPRLADGLSRCHPLLPFRMLLNMPLGLVSIAYGLKGENAVLYPGPLQGGMALATGFEAVARGRCRRALVGAAHHGLALLPLALERRRGRLAATPEEAGGAGGLWAATDAAAFLVLESAEAAVERGARPLAALRMAAARRDGGDPARAEAWRRLAEAGAALVLTSGTTGPGEARPAVRVRPLDPLLGHAGAAAPAVAAGLAALALAAEGLPAAAALAGDPDGGLALALLARPAEARP